MYGTNLLAHAQITLPQKPLKVSAEFNFRCFVQKEKSRRRHSSRKCRSLALTSAAAPVTTGPLRPISARRQATRLDEQAQRTILECLSGVKDRGMGGMSPQQQAAFETAIDMLEKSGDGVKAPTATPLLEGRWRLLYTSRPGSASPIQRIFVGVEAFSVFQEVLYKDGAAARVNNIVEFGKAGVLKVEAEASTDSAPLPGFTPRSGSGLPFGIMGVSSTKPPGARDIRLDFQFDCAAFRFSAIPLAIPYPVPFRLLGDERKGWIDVTYLSPDGKFRLSRGNKGTLFVLVREDPPKQALLQLISSAAADSTIERAAESLCKNTGDGVKSPARSQTATGGWRLLWTKQGDTANSLQRVLAGSVQNWQIISSDGKRLENRVKLLPGVYVRAIADAEVEGPSRTGVVINEVVLEAGPVGFALPVKTDSSGFVDWLYLDDDVRVTRGNKGSLFVHVRDDSVGIQ